MARLSVVSLTIFVTICAFFSVNGQRNVIQLNEDNWRDMLNGDWMVEFYAPWCPACKALHPTWTEFASWSGDLGIKVAQVDVTASPGLSGRFIVTALPTIYHVHNGEFRQYKGSRDKDSLLTFIENNKWKDVEPVPGWKSPNSIQMSIISSFFKLSQILRHIHNQLMDDFGLPTWGSYLIFAVATILIGALLGLVLVCLLDLIYPPKTPYKDDDKKRKPSEKGSGEELLPDEDIKDDLLDDASQSQSEEEIESEDVVKATSEEPSKTNSPRVKKRKPRRAD